ncbi:hypothetical protein EIP86_002415 [Pleurotus ostreatoroseus]|nr:hypothetical protein EIP86_002415 [Pleurotus ostreatoroseus]
MSAPPNAILRHINEVMLTYFKRLTYILSSIPRPGANTVQQLLPLGDVYTLPRNSVIEITINPGDTLGGPHPFHLHGHTFSVIRSANSTSNNYIDPVRRDVVSIGTDPNQGVTIRFTVTTFRFEDVLRFSSFSAGMF